MHLAIDSTSESMVSDKFDLVYDLCMTISNMQTVLLEFQEAASKASRDETRALILASKESVRTTTPALEPARSALRLLQRVLEEAVSWLNARGYLYISNQVLHASLKTDVFRTWRRCSTW